jgi:hypothetical protein
MGFYTNPTAKILSYPIKGFDGVWTKKSCFYVVFNPNVSEKVLMYSCGWQKVNL